MTVMINAEDRVAPPTTNGMNGGASVTAKEQATATGGGGGGGGTTTGGGNATIPRCVCGWKNCRVYQKAFREGQHPYWDGVVKLRFVKGDTECMALKASIDRILKVDATKRNDFKVVAAKGSAARNGANGAPCEAARYAIARHHFTEKHIQKYLSTIDKATGDTSYSFFQPFTLPGAKKYLYNVDERDTLQSDEGDLFYLQVPNNPKEIVKAEFLRIKDQIEEERAMRNGGGGGGGGGASRSRGGGTSARPEEANPADQDMQSQHSRQQEMLLHIKEQENNKLKEQLEAMQSQLTFLHDMVRKLQEEHLDHRSVRSGRSTTQRQQQHMQQRPTGGTFRGSTHSRSRRTVSSRSGRSVPREIELGDEDEGGSQWNENDWSEHYDEYDDGDETTVATFRVQYRGGGGGGGVQRRNSGDVSVKSCVSRATSIATASKSVKSLPREIELEEDEDDSQSHQSLDEEAFDNRSMASSWKMGGGASRTGHSDEDDENDDSADKYEYGVQNGGRMGTSRGSVGPNSKKPSRRSSPGDGGAGYGTQPANGQGTYQVQALVVTDPYGEQGTYTGSISASTNMPHGYGRLEYDRAGRWYEGDWKHGRWTGQGRLSNGDGDYYEGGLKNDHKHGHGIMKFADGRIFEGQYINGQMIEGKMTYQDGSTYTGSWVDGMRHGRGRCVFTDNSVYEGEFQEGEFYGHGKMSWSDGGWYEGDWVYGEMDGYGKEVRPDGTLRHEGQWRKGQPIRK